MSKILPLAQDHLTALVQQSNPLPAFKSAIRAACETLDAQFRAGEDIRTLISARAQFVDQILKAAWSRFAFAPEEIALLAVGGYGRGELHPFSDIDLLLLLAEDSGRQKLRTKIEGFLALLWDMGLEVGQSVRTADECAQDAKGDLTLTTNLMESRLLCGDQGLHQRLLALTDSTKLWPSAEFFLAKRREQRSRHAKYQDTEYNLEPNVKGSPGGLRDIQTLLWVARRQFGTLNAHVLVAEGFLLESEYALLQRSQAFLWQVRYALHLLAKRAEDRLLLNHQSEVAELLGFAETDIKQRIERFMGQYYRTVKSISELSELVVQHFEEAILNAGIQQSVRALNPRFSVRGDYIEASHPQVFNQHPPALLEIFLLLAQNPALKGIRAGTIRLLRHHLDLIDESFRQERQNTDCFIELFKAEQGIHRNLRRMSRYGVLARYLPEFGRIVGQMQHDLFHIYTVDAHSLLIIKQLRKLKWPELAEKFPLASKLTERIEKPYLLYLAALYHDIGKGSGRDHSEQGAIEAEAFCRRHHLPDNDRELLVWLVRQHLLMSVTAQRQDIADPVVIHEFASAIGDETHLNYLYLLTVADINATNPKLWNSWRASLLRQLYGETKRALRRGLASPLKRAEQVRLTQSASLDILLRGDTDQDDAEQLWQQLGEGYFLRHTAADVAWHTEAILQHAQDNGPLVLIRKTSPLQTEGGTQILIYAPRQQELFAVTVAMMDQLNLSIHDARIIRRRGFTLDSYIVLNADGSQIGDDRERIDEIRLNLTRSLQNPDEYPAIISRHVPRQLKHFAFPAEVKLTPDAEFGGNWLEIIAPDRPGLLARLGRIFMEFGLSLQNAKIATLGERVEDLFLISAHDAGQLADPAFRAKLCKHIQKQLSPKL
ncbi:[protein-PII] uridylyltransferase [Ventosimonas gracilis]|uniref:Bifunctional uridylyltransferase/uridylyl-removing enzyme n=1 Tax=Ventosimonas gracilis TaxID=1680762 RepID=A0A139SJ78_9GAMM|nr:[protein-PII] uridylyltransferase [Ventosimonas gracilis]KXU34607.1 [protein-PII] uridylyltransferase [Ventosimonas gracilis]